MFKSPTLRPAANSIWLVQKEKKLMANCPQLWPLFKSLSLPFKTSLLQDDAHGLFLLPFPNKATQRKQRLNQHIPEWRKPRDTGVIEHTAEISKSQPQTPAGSLRAYSEKVFKKPSIRNVKSKSPCSFSICKRGLTDGPHLPAKHQPNRMGGRWGC